MNLKSIITQTGGQSDITDLYLAASEGSTGTFTVGGGTLNVTNIIAGLGTSTLDVTGGGSLVLSPTGTITILGSDYSLDLPGDTTVQDFNVGNATGTTGSYNP